MSYTPKNKPGFIYFIRAEGREWVKIGWSVDPQQRLVEIQCGSPENLELLFAFPGTIIMERRTRGLFSIGLTRGEWVETSPELYDFIGRWANDPNGAADYIQNYDQRRNQELRDRLLRCQILSVPADGLIDWLAANQVSLARAIQVLGADAVKQVKLLASEGCEEDAREAADLLIATVLPFASAGQAA